MSAGYSTPIADALPRATEQQQNGFIAIRDRDVDQLLHGGGFEHLGKCSWNTAPEAIPLSFARWQVPPDHPVTQFLCQRVAGSWVDATVPGAAPVLGVTANAELKIRSEHAEAMVDRARLAQLLCRSRADRTLLRTSRELGDVATYHLPRMRPGSSPAPRSQLKKCARPSA